MRTVKTVFILGIIIFFSLLFVLYLKEEEITSRDFSIKNILTTNEDSNLSESYSDLFKLMGKDEKDLLDELGLPERKDPTPYGYEWWIYPGEDAYIQVGVKDAQVVTIFGLGDQVQTAPFTLGTSYDSLKEVYAFNNRVTYEKGLQSYTFKLKDEEVRTNPLLHLEKNYFAVLHFDQFTNELSAVRMLTLDTLTKQQMYDMEYRGALDKEVALTDEAWEEVEAAVERQIFDITNIYRKRHDLHPYTYNEDVAQVAYEHSRDMEVNNYFSHDNLRGESVGDRLRLANISFLQAAENIAYNYSDALTVSEGWLNSEGHRKALLDKNLREIGVGVYKLYYTQNFILK